MPFPKPEPRKRTKGRKLRLEATVKRTVRRQCVESDGYCLLYGGDYGPCEGYSQWAHFRGHRRSATMGMAPEHRHRVEFSGMLCARHHRLEEDGQLPDGWHLVARTVERVERD